MFIAVCSNHGNSDIGLLVELSVLKG